MLFFPGVASGGGKKGLRIIFREIVKQADSFREVSEVLVVEPKLVEGVGSDLRRKMFELPVVGAIDGQECFKIDAFDGIDLVRETGKLDGRILRMVGQVFAPEFFGLDVGDRH